MASVNKKQPRRPNDPASGSAPPGGGASVPLRRGSWRGAGGSSSGVPSPSSSPAPPSPAGPRPSDGPAGTTAGGVPPMQPKPSAAGLDGGGGPSSPLASPARGESPPADPLLAKIASFAGSKVDLILRSNARFQGTLAPAETSPQGSTTITLRMARDVSSPHQALTREMRWPASVVADVVKTTEAAAGKHGLNSDGFRTDRDISRNVPLGHERELTPWQALPVSSSSPSNTAGNGHSDFDTFGPSAGAGPSGSGRSSMGGWDQFAENERRFGTKTDFHEEMYTTKLDRSGKDFRERERRAEILASQIMGTASSNSHIQEERGQKLEDSSLGEEDKYSGVIRSNNAYVPPGARRTSGAAAGALKGAAAAVPSDVAKTALTEPAAAAPAPAPAPAAPKVEAAPAVAPTAPAAAPAASPATADKLALPATKATSFGAGESPAGSSSGEKTALSAFHEFVKSDRQRLELKKKQLEGKAKTEKDKRLKELMRFGQDFKLKTAIPEDLVPILAKDAEKQKAIVEKAAADARLAAARAAEKQAAAAAATAAAAAEAAAASPSPTPSAAKSVSSVASFANRRNLPPVVPGTSPQLPSTQAAAAAVKASPPTGRLSSMAIQDIPPFSRKPKSPAVTPAQPAPPPAPASALAPVPPSAAAAAVPRLNANAPTFVFKPTAPAFKPAGAAASSSSPASSSKSPSSILPEIPPHRSTLIQNQAGPSSHHGTPPPHHQQPQAQQASALPPNPFFGTKPFKKASSQVVNVRDDFNPHKHQKLAEASVQPPTWGTTGRPYRHLFPPAFSALGGGVGVGVMGGLTVGGGGGPQGHEGMPSPGMAHMALHPPLPPSGLVDFSNPYGPGVGVVDGVGVVHPGALTLGAAMAPGGQPPTMVSPSMLHAQLGGGVGGQPVPHQAGGGYPYGAGAGAYGQHGGGGYPYRGYPPPHHANGATGFQQPPGPPGGGGPTPPGGGGGGGGYMSHQQMYAAAAAAAAAGGGGGPPPNVYGGGGAGGPPHMQRNTSMGGAPPGGGNYYGGMQQSPQIGHSHIFPQQQQQQQQQQQPPPPPPFSPGPPPPPPGLPTTTTTTTTTTTAPSNSHGPPPPPPAAAPPVGGGH